MSTLAVGPTTVTVEATYVWWTSGMEVDADGAPNAYGPNNTGLDYTSSAGHPGDWWGVQTNTGQPTGTPIVQSSSDPCPGCYVSTTALGDPTKSQNDPLHYVNSVTVPYVSVPPDLLHIGVRMGDLAYVYNTKNGKMSAAICADVGPTHKIGEGSCALAEALGVPSSPRNGGTNSGITWFVFLGTASNPKWPRTVADIETSALALIEALGGTPRLVNPSQIIQTSQPTSFSGGGGSFGGGGASGSTS